MKKIKNRSLRLESLEDRMLLAVTAGGEAAAAELVAPAETGAEIVVNQVSYNALRSAIVKAQDGDTIVFADGLEGTIDATSYINIAKNITIDGGGRITIRGAGENNLLNITKSCTLTGLTFENGYSSTTGLGGLGAIGNGISVTMNNCNIVGNTGENDGGFGGAFYVTGQLLMNNCTVYGNSAIYGGFAYLYGRDNHGAALIDATNCTFYGNTSTGYGSVIGNAGGTVNLTNCTVVGNTTTEGAGAIASYEIFTVGGTDGAWTHEFMIGDTTIINSIIAYNKATDQATADIYTDYTKQLYGNGALQWDVFGMDDTFTKIEAVNSAIGVKGDYFVAAPTFDAEGNLDVDALDLTIKSDGIAAYAGIGANTVEYTGAGYTDADLVVTTLSDTIDSSDGEVSLREAIAYATLGTFEGAPTITFADGLADGTIVLANGQLAVTSNMRIVGDNITIDANEADRALFLKSNNYQFAIAGNYYNFESIPACPVHNFTDYCINVMVDGVNFTGGAATAISKASGGAGILVQQNANLVLRNSTISDNTLYLTDDSFSVGEARYTSIGGGGIAGILYAALALDNVTVVDNAVVQTGDRSTDIILQGGGIYIGIRSNIQMTDSTVSRNELTSQSYLNGNHSDWCFGVGRGAGIALFGELATISASEISANTITACAIEQYGGGIYYFNLSDSVFGGYGLIVTNSKITDNKVGDHNIENNGFCGGAGLYTSGKTLLVNDLIAGNSFDAGNASVNMTGYIHGAGICNATVKEYYSRAMNAASIDAYYCTVTNNTAACIDYAGYNTDSGSWGGGIASFGNGETYGAATVNFVGGILYHNYSKNSGTEATTNNDSYNGDNSAFNMSDTLYNTSGVKGDGYDYDNCIRWLARYKVFKDEANKDYTLWDGANPSQALDILSDTAPVPPAEYTSAYDVRNEPYVRVYGTAQDLGCYENQPEPAPTFELELTAYTGVYDAASHSITVSGVEAGDVVTYSADGETYGADVVSFADAGTYTVYVKAQREGYQEFNGSAAVTITAKALTVTGTTVADKTYDGTTAATVTLGTVEGIIAGDDVTVAADAAFPSAEVGDYDVTVSYTLSGASASNYAAPAADVVSASIIDGGGEQLAAPTITTGTRGIYVSYGANRHNIQWGAVANASGYEVQYSTDGGESWSRTISASGLSAVITGLTYGTDVTYRVRALGTGSYTDSDWSRTKTFNVCPMDINGDGDIAGSDRTIMATSWLAEEGEEGYQYYADINGDGEVSNTDRPFIGQNWNKEAGDDDLVYPRALRAADAAFAGYEAGDLDVDFDIF